MLVLSRDEGQEIVIGSGPDAVRVVLLRSRHGKARIGIHADPATPIVRGELPPLDEDQRGDAA